MPVLDPALAGSDQSLSAAYVDSVLPEVLAHYRLSREEVLARAGIAESSFARPEQLLPLVDVLRLFLVIMQACGDSGLGFEIGRRVKPRSYQVLGYVILASSNLGEAIDRLVRFESLSGKLGETRIERGDDQIRLEWLCPLSGEPARYLVEAAITGWVAFMRPLLADQLAPRAVCFRHAAPPDVARYEAYFQAPVQFDASFDGVLLAPALLSAPLDTADPGLAGMMEREARELLADFDVNTNLASAVRAEIYRQMVGGEPSLDSVAEALGFSGRALSKRLTAQSLRFPDMLDSLRKTLAELYMQDESLSLTDIALLLGFAESSSFSRAFRRWRGVSPNQYRHRE
ncbi:AraC family transcriptional regulator [Alcanivorax sp. DP30]|uniref:AraC family transcriptional regulator n=1 Tax=Alcanivorax sp. DP30 TaxID=2606217 RepID=UPI00137149CD|nr:AraC family transcriptional regulator [Alcanivorax sp. DP30]MZR63637.1 helix-turn-helix domain-containing protein [Alcanivorax sp. DP30]